MPNYTFQCKSCNRIRILNLPMEERNNPRKCPDCGGELKRKIEIPALVGFDKYGRSIS